MFQVWEQVAATMLSFFLVPGASGVQAYEILRCLGAELLGDDKKAVPKAVKHLTERRAAATVRHETVEGIFKSMVQDLRREEAPERRFCPELGFSLGALRMQGWGEVLMDSWVLKAFKKSISQKELALEDSFYHYWVRKPTKWPSKQRKNDFTYPHAMMVLQHHCCKGAGATLRNELQSWQKPCCGCWRSRRRMKK